MEAINKQNVIRWLVSTAVTFAAGFSIMLLADIDTITVETIQNGTYVGILFSAIRAGVKAVLEGFVAWYTRRK